MKKVVQDFLESGLTEAEFYKLPMDDLVNLREYLHMLQAKDAEFNNLIKPSFDSMKEKCDWIKDVTINALQSDKTGEYIQSCIWLIPNVGSNLIVKKDKDSGVYKDIAERIPFIYRISKNVRQLIRREEELGLIQDELGEIEKIGQSVYNGLLVYKTSISGKFEIDYFPNIGLSIWYDSDLLARYYVKQMKVYEKPFLGDESEDVALARIQVRK